MSGKEDTTPPSPTAVRDLVCGMWVEPATAKGGTLVHEGVLHAFCNPRCKAKFIEDPQKYLAPAPPAEVTPEQAGAVYTCPMDPEIEQIGPGTCPKCGMALEPKVATLDDAPDPEIADFTRRLLVAAPLSLAVLVLSMAEMVDGGALHHAIGPGRFEAVLAVLATPVVFYSGHPLLVRAVQSLRNASPNMFTLIGLGVVVAYLYSVVAWLFPEALPATTHVHGGRPAVYFEASAVITALVLVGQLIEMRARRSTAGAIRALLALAPKTARRIRGDGTEEDVELERVGVGDRLRVRLGEHVPVDGRVVEGEGACDESMITGESLPVDKVARDAVTGGTTLVSGTLVMQAERVGEGTLLARIVRTVAEAQRTRARIQGLADRVSAIFVPSVVVVALVSFAAWFAFGPEPRVAMGLVNAVAVLIIACPCAIGLATPMAIVVGVGRGATMGVLIRDADALETLAEVDTFVFDKTGTVTEGKPSLVRVVTDGTLPEDQLLGLAATLERASEHPLAKAVARGATERGLEFGRSDTVRPEPGRGIVGRVDGHEVRVVSGVVLSRDGGAPAALEQLAASERAGGATVSYVLVDGTARGFLVLRDSVKPGARAAIEALRATGARLVMLTGDAKATAEGVARELGLDEVIAEVLPEEKRDHVKALADAGRKVAMVGDGVNDAPALAQAHVGIAMGNGSDVAIEAAGIALVKGDLDALVRARRLATATMRNIRQNLALAFVYNLAGIPVAAGLLYPVFGLLLNPMIASAAMSFSSVSVIANALRLRRA